MEEKRTIDLAAAERELQDMMADLKLEGRSYKLDLVLWNHQSVTLREIECHAMTFIGEADCETAIGPTFPEAIVSLRHKIETRLNGARPLGEQEAPEVVVPELTIVPGSCKKGQFCGKFEGHADACDELPF